MVGEDARQSRIRTIYSGCREYRAESTIRFDDAAGGHVETAAAAAEPLRPGLPLSLISSTEIDTDTAAAGDVVEFKLRKPVRDRETKAVLAEAGAVVHGRILRVQHSMREPRRFTIDVALETIEAEGKSRPLYAIVTSETVPGSSKGVEARAMGQASLHFDTDKVRYRVPAGYRTEWVTAEAGK